MDLIETPLSTSPSHSNSRHFSIVLLLSSYISPSNRDAKYSLVIVAYTFCSQQRHFYLAVDRLQFKMETLVDLLNMAGRRQSLPIVVCCSTRDELDAVCSAVSNLSYINIAAVYSDLAEAERTQIFDSFRQTTMSWNRHAVESEETEDKEEGKSHMIVVTDACLPLASAGESPINGRILINYELPSKKETYMRRMATCLAADGIVINMVVGGEVVTLKSVEESSGLVIAEMPINIFEMM